MAVAIGEIVKNGIIFDLKNWQKGMTNINDFVQVIEDLFDTLALQQINYLLVGGVALLSYVEGRNTQDIDLILSKSALESLSEINVTEENKDFARGEYNGLQVDVLLTQNKLFNKILQQFATQARFGERDIRCVNVEGLVILKFYALPSLYRQGKFDRASIYENDILLLLLQYSIDIEQIFKVLSNHLLPTDLEQIREIAADIQSRVKRFASQKKKLESGQ